MVPTNEIWRADLPTEKKVFYVNNNPIATPPRHPILQRALYRATRKLLSTDGQAEIQSTTGPGNLTASVAAHTREAALRGISPGFEFIRRWDGIAETRWDLSYRDDSRNWRNIQFR